jgi:predicted MFS family arabinose efflux permease
MRIADKNIWRIYLTTFVVGLAYGLAVSLTSLFLDDRGFDKLAIGSLAAWFASGIVVFSLPMGALIRRFSAKAVLVACLCGYAAAITAFGSLESYRAIALVRFVDGACSVGVWVSCETILLARSDKSNKAFVTSLYAIAIAVGYIVGPVLARGVVTLAPMQAAFGAAGLLAALSALYVFFALDRDRPLTDHDATARTRQEGAPASGSLLWRIKTSCFATFAYGYFQASVVLFLPLYLVESKGISREQTILIPAFFASGMLLFSNQAGRIGDRVGHLLVMRSLGAVGTAMVLGFVFLDSYAWMCAAVFVAGASLASISPMSLALQGVVAAPAEYSRATSIYNAFYAAGMLLGPPVSSNIFASFDGASMLFHLAALWSLFVVFGTVFATDDPARSRQESRIRATGLTGV